MTARTWLARGGGLVAGAALAWLTFQGAGPSSPPDAEPSQRGPEPASDAGAPESVPEAAVEADATDAANQACPSLRRCSDGCCKPDEHCNVYQCYVPIPCGERLPACPTDTYCDDYVQGRAECVRMGYGWRERNAEFCERMDAGLVYLEERKTRWPRATGTCLPIMAPHHLHGRWYSRLGPILPPKL